MRVQRLNQLQRGARLKIFGPRSIFAGGEVRFKTRLGVWKATADRSRKLGCADGARPESAEMQAVPSKPLERDGDRG